MTLTHLKKRFSDPLLDWFDEQGRKDLPWQVPGNPYKVWVSEIMLQQTQVQTVIPYFNRFINQFPDLKDLARASEDQVLALWSGLGYYSRARNLHSTAQIIQNQHQGIFPQDLKSLLDLPGIGPSTAGAILSQAFNQSSAILDGNVKRVLCRFFAVEGQTEKASVKSYLWELARTCMPKERCADYTQAIMDLGALCCTIKNPNCTNCPLQSDCLAFQSQKQHLYPTKKIKKKVPLKQEHMLVLINKQGLIYLEKRPVTGVWGNLWSLPCIPKEHCPLAFIKDNYDFKGTGLKSIMSFKHKLSHFHLDINALSIRIHPLGNRIFEAKGKWFSADDIKSLGIAKPVFLILSEFFGKNTVVHESKA